MRDQIQEYIEWKIGNDVVEYAGLIVGVDTPDCGVSIITTGLAVVSPETPMGPEHILPVASLSKTFLAAVVLQLVEEGRLGLEDKLSNWRTDIPNAEEITVLQLLNHTSGIYPYMTGDFETACDRMFHNDPDLVWTPEDLLDCIDGKQPRFAPGTDWEYSNTNYVLLGLIVEEITGNQLHQEVRDRILEPLGLDHTFSLWNEDVDGEMAHSYERRGSPFPAWVDITDDYHYSFYWACGGMASSAEDLLIWSRGLMTGEVIEESTLAEMKTCIDLEDAGGPANWDWTGYGLGLIRGNHEIAGDVFGHSGDFETAVADIYYIPSWDASVAVQINHCFCLFDPGFHENIVGDVFGILGEYH